MIEGLTKLDNNESVKPGKSAYASARSINIEFSIPFRITVRKGVSVSRYTCMYRYKI